MKPKAVARGVWQVGLRGVNVFLIEAGDGLDEEHVDAPQADLPYTASDRLGFHVRASS